MLEHVYCIFHHLRYECKTLIHIYLNEEAANTECDRPNKEDESDDWMWYSVEPHTLR
jgi:hypothetical protein